MERSSEFRLKFTLKVHGSFDFTAAVKAHDAIKELPRAALTRVDFTDSHPISDHALVRFVELIPTDERGAVQLLGLSTHHQRLLRYLWPEAQLGNPTNPKEHHEHACTNH